MHSISPRRLTAQAACVLAIVLAGCGSSGGNHNIPPPPELINGQFVFQDGEGPSGEQRSVEEQARFDWTQKIDFDAPNKSRVNPFVAGVEAEQGQSGDGEETDDENGVRVKGFSKLDRVRVFLRVGDDFRSLKEGESLNNVRIVKIHPPHVTLVRDGEEETRSLLEEPTDQARRQDDALAEDDGDLWTDPDPLDDITS